MVIKRERYLHQLIAKKWNGKMDDIIPWTDDAGIQYIGIQEFLLNHIDKI